MLDARRPTPTACPRRSPEPSHPKHRRLKRPNRPPLALIRGRRSPPRSLWFFGASGEPILPRRGVRAKPYGLSRDRFESASRITLESLPSVTGRPSHPGLDPGSTCLRRSAAEKRWMPDQVRHDEAGKLGRALAPSPPLEKYTACRPRRRCARCEAPGQEGDDQSVSTRRHTRFPLVRLVRWKFRQRSHR